MDSVRIGVLASGRGSNFSALVRHQESGYFARAQIVGLVSNISSAGALEAARTSGIAADFISPKQFGTAAEYEQAIIQTMDQHGVEWLVLAGYMKIVGATLLARYPQRIINIHPSLLPAFPGLHAQRQALEHGVRVSGCTVHFVDSGMDTGPIIGQRAVPVMSDYTEDSLAARILVQEHELFAESLKRVTEESWRIEGRRVIFD